MEWNLSDLDSASCMDPSKVFDSFDTLARCFSIYGLPDDTDSGIKHGLYLNVNSTFGSVIGDCLEQYCQFPDPDLSGCSLNGLDANVYYKLYDRPRQEFYTATCASVDNDVNDDLGGVGVLMSFMMQVCFVVYIYLAFRTLRLIRWCIRRGKRRRDKDSITPEFGHHHFSILKSMMVEFQESQCFFMLSFQCAVLIALAAGPQVFEATSLRQLMSNMNMAKTVAYMGIIPITYGLWILDKVQLHSWYISLWSTVTVVVSTVTFHMCHLEPSVDNLQGISTADRLDKCGYHPPPIVYCSGDIFGYGSPSSPLGLDQSDFLNNVCLAIYGLLVFKRLTPYPKKLLNQKTWFQHVYRCVHPLLVSKPFRFFANTLTVLVEIFLLACNLWFLLLVLVRCIPMINLDSWSFGQIIAVSIWAPIVSKYLYWVLFGTESYSAIRFPSPYKIIRVKSSEEDPDKDRLFIHLASTEDLSMRSKKKVTVTDVELTPVSETKNPFVSKHAQLPM